MIEKEGKRSSERDCRAIIEACVCNCAPKNRYQSMLKLLIMCCFMCPGRAGTGLCAVEALKGLGIGNVQQSAKLSVYLCQQ